MRTVSLAAIKDAAAASSASTGSPCRMVGTPPVPIARCAFLATFS
ncbi:MAG: hypothetical protein R3D28_14875 [Geminicoccaceae bacterium]